MTISEIVQLVQAALSFGALVVVVFYTAETRKLRRNSAEQLDVMWGALNLERQRDILAAEPVFRWEGRVSYGKDEVTWKFENFGRGVSHVTIALHGKVPPDLHAEIKGPILLT